MKMNQKIVLYWLVVSILWLFPSLIFCDPVGAPFYSFTSGTKAYSESVNNNFQKLKDGVDSNYDLIQSNQSDILINSNQIQTNMDNIQINSSNIQSNTTSILRNSGIATSNANSVTDLNLSVDNINTRMNSLQDDINNINAIRVGYLNIDELGMSKTPVTDFIGRLGSYGYYHYQGNDDYFYTPVNLPHNSSITQIYLRGHDSTDTDRFIVEFCRGNLSGTSYDVLVTLQSDIAEYPSGYKDYIANISPSIVVDNENYGYFFRVKLGGINDLLIAINGIRIAYLYSF